MSYFLILLILNQIHFACITEMNGVWLYILNNRIMHIIFAQIYINYVLIY